MSTLHRFLALDDILLGVAAPAKQPLFDAIGRHMQMAHGLPADDVASALARREAAASTALGHGVAIPHARVKALEEVRMVYVRLTPALPFGAPDNLPVSDVVALMVPAPATQVHLDILAQVASLFSDAGFRTALHACNDPAGVRALFQTWPR